ncbi:MAG: hypothetical protein JSR47_21960 [Proteobacteria bacterium]|nr:hypothetical protein [Pseudomonadota bacterium]
MEKNFRYPRRVVSNSLGPAIVSIFALVIPTAVVAILQLIGMGHTNVDFARTSIGFDIALVAGWIVLMMACVPRAVAYLQSFELVADGIRRSSLLQNDIIRWNEIVLVEKRTSRNYIDRQFIDEVSISIQGLNRRFTIFEQLDDFDTLKGRITNECHVRSVPLFAVDRTRVALQALKKRDRDLYRKSRWRGIRYPITSL